MRDDRRRTTDDRRRTMDGRRWLVAVILLTSASTLMTGCTAPVATAVLAKMETGVDSAAWAQVPAGEFVLGQHEEKGSVNKPYEIMLTDVINAQYARYLNEALTKGTVKIQGDQIVGYYPGDPFHGHKHEKEIKAGDWLHVPLKDPSLRLTFDGKTFGVKPGYENHPMTMVTWFGAKTYCDFYGWRLPSEVEWEKAARGTDNRPFPWGNQIELNSANFYASRDPFEQLAGKWLASKQGYTTPVGLYNGKIYDGYQTADSRSPYGLYDMAGNVWQWAADLQEGIHDRWLRGGSKDNYGYNLRIWEHNSARPDYASPSVGFRCAR
jgi:formylglycine-generating enzyme required for sulfatase activity